MGYGRIYGITNQVSGKKYVGKTICSLEIRWNQHRRSKRKTALAYAIKKYGPDAFVIRELAVAGTREELNYLERWFISWLDSRVPNGYNLREGGDGGPHSPETLAKLCALHTDSQYKARRLEGLRKFWDVPENKKRMLENLQAIRRANYANGKRHKSHKETTDKSLTKEWREKRGDLQKEIWKRPEYREKMRQVWSRPGYLQARAEAIRAGLARKNQDPEWRKFRSDDMKRVRKDVIERRALARKEGS